VSTKNTRVKYRFPRWLPLIHSLCPNQCFRGNFPTEKEPLKLIFIQRTILYVVYDIMPHRGDSIVPLFWQQAAEWVTKGHETTASRSYAQQTRHQRFPQWDWRDAEHEPLPIFNSSATYRQNPHQMVSTRCLKVDGNQVKKGMAEARYLRGQPDMTSNELPKAVNKKKVFGVVDLFPAQGE